LARGTLLPQYFSRPLNVFLYSFFGRQECLHDLFPFLLYIGVTPHESALFVRRTSPFSSSLWLSKESHRSALPHCSIHLPFRHVLYILNNNYDRKLMNNNQDIYLLNNNKNVNLINSNQDIY
jgi:hypothetical protein